MPKRRHNSDRDYLPIPAEMVPYVDMLIQNTQIRAAGIKSRRRLSIIICSILLNRWRSYNQSLKADIDSDERPDQVVIPGALGLALNDIMLSKLMDALVIHNKAELFGAALRNILNDSVAQYKPLASILKITVDDICQYAKTDDMKNV